MKRLLTVALTALLLSSCAKMNEQPTIKGKLVYRSCATIVVQVLDSNHYSIAQSTWRQSATKQDFGHVFAVANQCSFPGSVTVGEQFFFRVENYDPNSKGCVSCALYDNPPQKSNIIKVINEE